MAIPYVLSDESASIFLDFVPFTVPNTHANWTQILEALADPATTEDDVRPLLDVAQSVADFMLGAVEYRDRALYYNGKPLDTPLTRRIIEHMSAGQEGLATPLIAFLENVMQNPSRRAVLGLYEWVERSGLPITPDGHIMAYKIVNHDFTDCYSRSFDNSPGKVVEVERYEVDEDPDQTCSYGLHVCSASYLPSYGPSDKQVVIVKINPADFVAVPRDYNVAKARVCRYEVLQAVPPETAAQFFPSPYVYDPTPAPTREFEVGQVWRNRAGELVTITEIDDDDPYSASAMKGENDSGEPRSYYLDGLYFSDQESDEDLVEFVSDDEDEAEDTSIDWSQPIETVNGQPAEFVGTHPDGHRKVSLRGGGVWYYREDGTHIYGQEPVVRNVKP